MKNKFNESLISLKRSKSAILRQQRLDNFPNHIQQSNGDEKALEP